MMEKWVDRELESAELLDKRLETRFRVLLDSLSQHSQASIPAACDARSEMVAAYRFFDNEKVTFESVLAPHIESSCQRVSKQKVALLIQDTTGCVGTRGVWGQVCGDTGCRCVGTQVVAGYKVRV